MTDTNNEWIEQARLTYNEIPIGGKECKDEETAFKQAILYNLPKPTEVVAPVDIEDIIEKILYIKRYSDTRYFDLEEVKKELKKLIIDNLPQSISREAVEKIDENTSDGYHTFKELYEHRIALYIRLINDTDNGRIKSLKHFDGSGYDGRFIVMGYINQKQISYHLPIDKRELVKCKVVERADEWDGHTPADVVNRLLSPTNSQDDTEKI